MACISRGHAFDPPNASTSWQRGQQQLAGEIRDSEKALERRRWGGLARYVDAFAAVAPRPTPTSPLVWAAKVAWTCAYARSASATRRCNVSSG